MYKLSFMLFNIKITILSENKFIYDILAAELIEKTKSQQYSDYFLEINYLDNDIYDKKFLKNFMPKNVEIAATDRRYNCNTLFVDKNISIYVFKNYIYNNLYNYFNKYENICFFHATTIEKDGYAYMILGNKNSGKTTKAIKLCLEYEFNLISDDVTSIKFDSKNKKYLASGIFRGFNMNKATYKMLLNDNHNLIEEDDKNLKNRYFLTSEPVKEAVLNGVIVLDSANHNDTIVNNVLSLLDVKREFVDNFLKTFSDKIKIFNLNISLSETSNKLNDIINLLTKDI